MTVIVGVVGAALLFGLFAMLRPSERGCTGGGHCLGCTHDGACESKRTDGRHDDARSLE